MKMGKEEFFIRGGVGDRNVMIWRGAGKIKHFLGKEPPISLANRLQEDDSSLTQLKKVPMNSTPARSEAFGKPGMEPRWTSSAKEGIGTAWSTSCQVWFTLSHGILNEVYYPTVDVPNLRDLQFLITDGETFFHEERSDLESETDYGEQGALVYKIRNKDPEGRYEIIKEFICAPHGSVVLISGRLIIHDPAWQGRLKVYLLAAPHMVGQGKENDAYVWDQGGETFLHATRHSSHIHSHMMIAAKPSLGRRSVGYVGQSDGFQDLVQNKIMDWEFTEATGGNVAMMAEMKFGENGEFFIAIGMGASPVSASTAVTQTLAVPYAKHRESYVAQWRRASFEQGRDTMVPATFTGDDGSPFRASRCVLLAHEDKISQGATVASISIPWGDSKDDTDKGGYHLVWPRDLYHSMMALTLCSHEESALRALIWLSNVQMENGSMPQNCWINGKVYWCGRQLDETAAPILLAWQLRERNALGQFDPWPFIQRSLRFLLLNGPVTGQERWEEASGYSPATLAGLISAMICAADFADEQGDSIADLLRSYADWINDHLEGWTVTRAGTLHPEISRHYIRINPADPEDPHADPDPDTSELQLANGGGLHPARNIMGGDFLELVRYGIRAADDPIIRDSVRVYDAQLKVETPNGPCWRRYNFDGYGEHRDGAPFDGSGYGGAWPLLTGERGHYALANGEDPRPYIQAMENFANQGQMLPEQIWALPDVPDKCLYLGEPAGSAMPLCWAHAEYIALTKSAEAGVPIDRPDIVFKRYAQGKKVGGSEFWMFQRQPATVWQGRSLVILLADPARIRYSRDHWQSWKEIGTVPSGIGVHVATLHEVRDLDVGGVAIFTFVWADGHWEGKNFQVTITAPIQIT